jgi:fibronectin-binding autotransporter adhesin
MSPWVYWAIRPVPNWANQVRQIKEKRLQKAHCRVLFRPGTAFLYRDGIKEFSVLAYPTSPSHMNKHLSQCESTVASAPVESCAPGVQSARKEEASRSLLLRFGSAAIARKYSARVLRVAPEIGLRGLAAIMALFALCGFNPQALATTYYWDTTTTGTWATGANWSNNASTGGTTGTVPLSTDSVVFDQSSVNGNETVQLSGATSITGVTFANTGTTLIDSSSTTSEALTLGTGGITINSGAGAVTIGNATDPATITLGGVETWANNASTLLTVVNAVTNGSNNLNITGGNTTVSGVIGNGSGSVTYNGTGTLTLSGANTFTGGLTIQAGTVTAATSAAALGAAADAVTLGNTSGSSAATLLVSTTGLTYANPIKLGAGGAGTLTIGNTGTAISTTFSGGVTLANNLTISDSSTTGDITFSTGSINNTGTITNTGSGTSANLDSTVAATALQGTTIITGAIGANVTNVIENSSTSDLLLGAVNSAYTGNITITNGTVVINSHASALGSGAGTVVLGASASSNNAGLVFGGRLLNVTGASESYSNPISVLGTGTNFISATDFAVTFSGAVALNSNTLTISGNNSGGSTIAITGGVTGTGNIIANNAVTTITNAGEAVTFTTHPVNNAGTISFTNSAFNGGAGSNGAGSGTGVVANSITGGVGSNVTGISTSSGSEPLNITTNAITVNSGGTTLTNNNTNTVAINSQSGTTGLFTVSGGVGGAGNLILDNDSSIASGITLSTTSVNNTGSIINQGTGSGSTLIGAVIGTNVTGVTENSATSGLTLSGANTYSGATTINAGTLALTGAAGAINSSSVTINGSGAKFLDTSSVVGTAPITLTEGTMDGTGTVGAVTVGAGTGGIVTNGNGGTTALTLASLDFTGAGTLTLNQVGGASITTPSLAVTGLFTSPGTAGSITVNLNQSNAFVNGSTYDLLSYGSYAGLLTDFVIGTGLTARQTTGSTFGTSGGFLTLAVSGDSPVWTGTSTGIWTTASTGSATSATPNWTLLGAHTATDFWVTDTVQFNDTVTTASGTITPTNLVTIQGGSVSPGSMTFNNSILNYTIQSGDGSGIAAGSFTMNGTGSVTLTSTNTFTGATTINAGTLNLGAGGSLKGTAITVGTGGAFNEATTSTVGGLASLATSGNTTLSGSNSFTGATNVNGGTLALTSGGSLNGSAVTVATSGTMTEASTSAITGGVSLTTSGNTTLSGSNSFTGATNVNGGTLALTNGGSLNGSAVTVATSGTLTEVATSAISGNVSLTTSGNTTLSGTNTYTGATTAVAGTLSISGGGTISGAGTLTMDTGTTVATSASVTVADSNPNFTGAIMVGTYVGSASSPVTDFLVEADQALGTGLITIAGNGDTAILQLSGGIGLNNPIQFDARTAATQVGIESVSGNNTLSGLITGVTGGNSYVVQSDAGTLSLTGGINLNHTLVVQGNGNGLISGVVADTASDTGGLTISGPGTWTLSAANTYVGPTAVNLGTLVVSGSLSGTASVSVAGKLEADGLVNTSATVSLSSGGQLDGVGSVGAVTSTGGIIAPGNTIGSTAAGILTANGNVSLDSASSLSIRIGVQAEGDYDQLAIGGAHTLTLDNSNLLLNVGSIVNDPTLADIGDQYIIVNGGAIEGAIGQGTDLFTSVTGDTLSGDTITTPGGLQFDIEYGYDPATQTVDSAGTDIALQLVAVPEPATWESLLGGLGILIAWRRRRSPRMHSTELNPIAAPI